MIRKNTKHVKTPLPKGRPLGKKWKNARLFSMTYCPDVLGGDHRSIWAIVGHKWVHCSTNQLCKAGGNRKATVSRQAWEKLVATKNNTVQVLVEGGIR